MKSFTTLSNLFTNLSNNNSTDNQNLGKQLINDQARYLIQKYFDNEKTVTTSTVGSQNLTATAAVLSGATSATLTAAWAYPTGYAPTTFSNGQNRNVLYTNASTGISWDTETTSDSTTAVSCLGFQFYEIPANISKITNDTITVGQLKFTTIPIQTRSDWDRINFLPYNSDIPAYNFIYNGQLGIFPIPSTTGNVLTFNYKIRAIDMTFDDYSTGHINTAGMTVGSTAVTGTGTSWDTTYPLNTDVGTYNLYLRADPPNGDGVWYPISKFTSATTLVLANPVINAPNITSSTTYTIGQMPLLYEDFHDMLVYGALLIYFSTIVDDPNKYKQFQPLYQSRLQLMEDYLGTKQIDVDLGNAPQQVNPNLFLYAPEP